MMWTLAKKNSLMFLINSVLLLAVLCLHWFVVRKTLDAMMVMFQAQLLAYMILASVIGTEQKEAKTNSRAFLLTLPVKPAEIVGARFLTVFLAVGGIAAFDILMYEFIPGPPSLIRLGRLAVFSSAAVTLILAGLLYIFLFRHGVSKTIKIGWIVTLGIMIVPFVLIEILRFRLKFDFSPLAESLSRLGWPGGAGLLTLAGFLYLGLARRAVKTEAGARG